MKRPVAGSITVSLPRLGTPAFQTMFATTSFHEPRFPTGGAYISANTTCVPTGLKRAQIVPIAPDPEPVTFVSGHICEPSALASHKSFQAPLPGSEPVPPT